MALRKTPEADIKRKYPFYVQIGAVLALLLVLGAFTVPLSGSEEVTVMADDNEIIEIEDIEQTKIVEPPPPPPPAPPPPQEVPDDAEIEEVVIDAMDDMFSDTDFTPREPVAAGPGDPPPPPPGEPEPEPEPEEPEPTEPEIFEVVEQSPELIGGIPELQKRVEYPEMARRAGVEGRVFLQFVVDERGQVSDAVCARSPNDLLCEAALDALRKSEFRPGMQRGRPVKVRFTLPVDFKLR
ncbi:MAG: energy transducer TonB [Bacteroidota bacterium]